MPDKYYCFKCENYTTMPTFVHIGCRQHGDAFAGVSDFTRSF